MPYSDCKSGGKDIHGKALRNEGQHPHARTPHPAPTPQLTPGEGTDRGNGAVVRGEDVVCCIGLVSFFLRTVIYLK